MYGDRPGGKKPARKKKPTKTSIAKSQERAYASQGRQIQHAAQRQKKVAARKPVAPSPAVREQHAAVAQARSRPGAIQNKAHLKRVKKAKANPSTPANRLVLKERHAEIGRTRAARWAANSPKRAAALSAHEQAAKTSLRPKYVAPKPKKGFLDSVGDSLKSTFKNVYGGKGKGKGGTAAARTNRGQGIGVAGGLPAKVVKNTGIAIAQNPGKTTKGLAQSLVSIPAGVVAAGTHPKKAVKAIGKDYSRRYGPLVRGDEKAFQKRLKKEGAAPELLDIAGSVSAGGATGGRIAQSAAKAGRLGAKAERVATRTQRVNVGGHVVERAPHPNLIRNASRAGVDKVRTRVQVKRAGHEDAPVHVREAQAKGQVTYVGRRKTARVQRRLVAKEKGRMLVRMKAEQQRQTSEARQAVSTLDKHEKAAFKYAMQYGAHDAESGRRVLEKHRARIVKEREQLAAKRGGKLHIPRHGDELKAIDELLSGKHGHAKDIQKRPVKRAALQAHRTATMRDLGRGGAEEYSRNLTKEAGPPGKITKDRGQNKKGDHWTDYRYFNEKGENVGYAHLHSGGGRTVFVDPKYRRQGIARKLYEAGRADGYDVTTLGKGNLQTELGDVLARSMRHKGGDSLERAFTPRLRKVVEQERARSERVVKGDPGVAPEQAQLRRYAPVAEHLGIKRAEGESNAVFLRRVKKAANAEGLKRPAYFPSEKRPEGVFGSFAIGGNQAIRKDSKYTGALTRTGREFSDPSVHVQGVAKNIKRKYNWNLVANQYDKHALAWSKEKPASIAQLKDELEHRGIDPASVAFWNPKRYRAIQKGAAEHEGKLEMDPTLEGKDVSDALAHSSVHGDATMPEDFKESKGWVVVPKAVHDELTADTKPSGGLARSYDIVKGKASRILLANPAWAQFQVASNALMTGISGTHPVDLARAPGWWKKLTPEEQDSFGSQIGVHKWYDDQRKLGASTNSHIVNGYRALKETHLWQMAHKVNPLDALFRFDNAQNNFFRKAVLYNRVKREAYARMNMNASTAIKAQRGIIHALSPKRPGDLMQAVLRDGEKFEEHAKAVNDFLGDWTTYTAKERRVFSRSVMFYGFLRFSLRLAFYTMPVEHPIMSSVLLQLGRLQNDELQELFGKAGAEVPPWEVGNLYSKDGKRKWDTTRLNPFFNALQYRGPQSLAGSFSPLAQVALNQVAGKNVSLNQRYKVDGSTAEVTPDTLGGWLSANRAQIAIAELARTSPYYRMLEQAGAGPIKPLRGKQGSDSSLLFPQPTKYKRADAVAKNDQMVKEQKGRGALGALQEQTLPALGQDARQTLRSSAAYAKTQGKKKKAKKKTSLLSGSSRSKSLLDGPSKTKSLLDGG